MAPSPVMEREPEAVAEVAANAEAEPHHEEAAVAHRVQESQVQEPQVQNPRASDAQAEHAQHHSQNQELPSVILAARESVLAENRFTPEVAEHPVSEPVEPQTHSEVRHDVHTEVAAPEAHDTGEQQDGAHTADEPYT